MRRPTALLLALTAFVTLSASSQQDRPSSSSDTPTYVETFEVRVQNLDVIVIDRRGDPVAGLTRKDFVLLENGAEQEISNFSAYDESAGIARTTQNGTAQETVAVVPPPRKVVFFIDQISLHPVSREKIVKSAMQLVEGLADRDQVMIVAASGPRNVVLHWTSDRKMIGRALEDVISTTSDRYSTEVAGEIRYLESQFRLGVSKEEMRDLRRRYADAVRRRVTQRLGMLRALVASIAGLEGKKILVTISSSLEAQPGYDEAGEEQTQLMEGFTGAMPGSGAPGQFIESAASPSTIKPTVFDLRPLIADLGRTAAASGVTIYPLQPDVPLELVAPGSLETRNNRRSRGQERWSRVLQNNEMTMVSLAETTGGRWFRGDGRVDDVFRQIADDVRSYYSLAYHVKGEKNRPRDIEVRVKNRPDLTVRTRSEAQEKSIDREMTDLTMAALLYNHPVNELSIEARAAKPVARRDVFSIPVEVQIPMSKLTFLPTSSNRYRATFRVHYALSGERRDFVAGEQREQTVDISADELRALEGKTFRYSADMVVLPGSYRIAIGVYDAASHLSGFDMVRVETR